MQDARQITFPAADGFELTGTLYPAAVNAPVLIVNSATAVPHLFYRRFASYFQKQGWTVLTYDYRGIGASAPKRLRGFKAHVSDWGLKDIQGAVDFAETGLKASKICLVGHSAGGQQAGMITRPERITAMATMSAQSGYWRLQGGREKLNVWFLTTLFIPVVTRLFGYLPWKAFGGEDLPRDVALEWAAWCRAPGYLRDDKSLPLERYDGFTAPVLAYSVEDDGWGTKQAVHAMMSAYPNVTFKHLVPKDEGLAKLGHMGAFRAGSEAIWARIDTWLREAG